MTSITVVLFYYVAFDLESFIHVLLLFFLCICLGFVFVDFLHSKTDTNFNRIFVF